MRPARGLGHADRTGGLTLVGLILADLPLIGSTRIAPACTGLAPNGPDPSGPCPRIPVPVDTPRIGAIPIT